MSYKILICDDDPDIRAAMRRTLNGHDVTEAGSPAEAFGLLRQSAFEAIVADYQLGADSDGLDLLQHARLGYPDMIRFLVTGTRDIDVALRAVNEGAVHRFFLKPWDDVRLRAALDIVLRSRRSAPAHTAG